MLDKGLGGDEMGERVRLVIDGVDGRVHHVELEASRAEEIGRGMIVAAGPAPSSPRAADRNIMDIAGTQGIYRPSAHLERRVPADLPERGQAYDLARDGANIRVSVLSPLLAEPLVSQSDALAGDKLMRAPKDLIQRLEAADIERAGKALAAERGRQWQPATPGNYVSGQLAGSTQRSSGRFAMIDNGLGFSLVPWRPALEQHIGRHISGIAIPGGDVDWSFVRSRGLGL